MINETRAYNERVDALLCSIGTAPIERAKALNKEGVPFDDPRRIFVVDADTFDEARKLGFTKAYGLRLVQIGT